MTKDRKLIIKLIDFLIDALTKGDVKLTDPGRKRLLRLYKEAKQIKNEKL